NVQYRLLGKTVDDAPVEAFDKAARILGLSYTGGPAVQKAAADGDPNRFHFPHTVLKGTLDFSYSGLKTALLRKVEEYGFSASKPAPWQITQGSVVGSQLSVASANGLPSEQPEDEKGSAQPPPVHAAHLDNPQAQLPTHPT